MEGVHKEIVGQTVIMRPYLRMFVEMYHAWMEDPVLCQLTASEPLTLEEEYAMQESWVKDDTKCTFILFDRSLPDGLEGMCGDVNLYLNDPDDAHSAEIEIMIAEVGSRRKGIAKEALLIMMAHGQNRLGITRFVAKIGFGNRASQKLFARLGYRETVRSEVFQEITFECQVEDAAEWLNAVHSTVRYQALSIEGRSGREPCVHPADSDHHHMAKSAIPGEEDA